VVSVLLLRISHPILSSTLLVQKKNKNKKGENKGPGRTEDWPTFEVEVSDSEIDSESVDTVVLVASLKRHSDPKRKKVCPDLRMSSRQILGV
jgi:hypothetical protein